MSASVISVSVVVAAYKSPVLLRRALQSVTAQDSVRPAEVIVVDDASDDGTADVALQTGARVIRHRRNRGIAAARATGVEAATQRWVALLDQDDEWLPHHLRSLWEMRRGHVLVADSALRCGADPTQDRLHGPISAVPVVLNDPACLIYPGNVIPFSAAMVRRDIVEAVGGFRPPDGVDDMDLWIRVLERGTGVISPAVTVIYHLHDGQASQNVRAMQERHIMAARRFSRRLWWSDELLERWKGRTAWNEVRSALRRRRPTEAVRHALWIAARPQRAYGAIQASLVRARLARRSARVGRDGGPSLAVVSRNSCMRARAMRAIAGRPMVDIARRTRLGACIRILSRPPSLVVSGSKVEAVLLRATGVKRVIDLRELEYGRVPDANGQQETVC